MTGAQPANAESTWLYPSAIHGNPVSNQPRAHSTMIQTAGATSSRYHGSPLASRLISQPVIQK